MSSPKDPDGIVLAALRLAAHKASDMGIAHERTRALAYIRAQALKGTADDEVKLTRLAGAIERGEHE